MKFVRLSLSVVSCLSLLLFHCITIDDVWHEWGAIAGIATPLTPGGSWLAWLIRSFVHYRTILNPYSASMLVLVAGPLVVAAIVGWIYRGRVRHA